VASCYRGQLLLPFLLALLAFLRHLRDCIETLMNSGFQCAACGEWNETVVDPTAGTKQTYVEDCQVCCKPNVLRVTWDKSAGEYTISAESE